MGGAMGRKPNERAGIGAVTLTLTTGLMVCLSPHAASAYAAAKGPVAQMEVLNAALADGSAVPLADPKLRVEEKQLAFADIEPPDRAGKKTKPKKKKKSGSG